MKRIIVIVVLSVGLAPIFCSGIDYYVDSQTLSSGDGSSSAPFKTIQEGIDAASAGDTVYLRGSLYVSQASQCVVIPADKPELTLAKWGANRFSIEVDNDFAKDNVPKKATTNIITVCAQSNTVIGIEFIYHRNSLGQQDYGKGSFIFFCTNYQTVADCRFYRPPTSAEAPGYDGVSRLIDGKQWGQNNSCGQDYITVRNCVFENAFGYRGDTHKYPIGVGDHATIANCVFSNCWAIAAPIQNNGKFNYHAIVSNVLILAAMDSQMYLVPAEQHSGVFYSALGGMGKGEIAYNIFVGRNRDLSLFNYGSNVGFKTNDKVRFHHNTVIGFACLFSGGKTAWKASEGRLNPNIYGENQALFEFADNIIDANVLFYENATNVAHQASAIKAGSVFRNNAVCLTNNSVIATGKATSSAMYNLTNMLTMTENIFLNERPVFVETNDIYNVDFYRPRLRLGQDADLRRIGWTGENNEYPRFVGAREPIAPGSFTIHLR